MIRYINKYIGIEEFETCKIQIQFLHRSEFQVPRFATPAKVRMRVSLIEVDISPLDKNPEKIFQFSNFFSLSEYRVGMSI